MQKKEKKLNLKSTLEMVLFSGKLLLEFIYQAIVLKNNLQPFGFFENEDCFFDIDSRFEAITNHATAVHIPQNIVSSMLQCTEQADVTERFHQCGKMNRNISDRVELGHETEFSGGLCSRLGLINRSVYVYC